MTQLTGTLLLLMAVCSCTVRASTCPSCPVFSQASYSSSILENAAIGTSVVQLLATDPDGDTLSFSIAPGSGTTAFSIEASTGVIRVASNLDYETTPSYTLYVVVTDSWSEVVTMVTITVLDVLEIQYHVECDPMVLSVEVAEDTPAMTNTSQRIVCLDPDHSDASFTYSLSSSSGESPISLQDGKGFVLLAHELDYEHQTLHTVTVSFIDQNGNHAIGSATVVVSVVPINEFSPQFSDVMITSTITESAPPATSVGRVTATDADNGLDGQVTYSVAGGNGSLHFTIHPSTGDIISIAPLDYEQSTEYWLVVMATDSPTNSSFALSSSVTLTVLVTDVNDNIPLFSKHIYRSSVSEDVAGSVAVLQVHCTDDDTGVNQVVMYSLLDDAMTQFSIDESNGVIQVATALDYEASQRYLFTVQCTDSGVPPLYSTAMVIVEITSANEFTPTFATSSVLYNVAEDTIVGTELGQLIASDGDNGLAGVVSFAVLHSDIYCPNNLIQIDNLSGQLYLTGALDYESSVITSHQLLCQVQAMDSQQVIRTGVIDVLMVILNINDNPPQCDPSVIAITVSEDTLAGSTSLYSFSCSDADSSPLSYTTNSSMFGLDTTSGTSVQLLLSEALDYESETYHHVTVLVTDGLFNTTINIFITIEEVNEHTPIFTQDEYHCSVFEMMAPGTLLSCAVTANDADQGSDGELHYAITTSSSPFSNYFTINSSSGIIIVAKTLDYETDPVDYSLTVSAIDHSLTAARSSSTAVTITLLDLNDNAPIMDSTSIFTISEDASINSIVGVATCSDADSGSNGAVNYSILSTNRVLDNGTLYPASAPLPFNINNSTGVIKTITTLDFEAVSAYKLLIECVDLGSPQLTTEAVAIISIQPVNEFIPVIEFPPDGLSLVINPLIDAIGSTLITVSATDQDKGSDGVITYSSELINPVTENHVQVLAVDLYSGSLGLVSLPSCALGNELRYRITASNGGSPSLNSSTIVNVLVMQSCDLLPPTSSASLHAASVLETAQVDTSVVQVTCTNPNSMSSLSIKYMITNSTEDSIFYINEDTGQVKVAALLDYEQVHQVMISVRCYYSDDAILNTDVTVYINILPVNEFAPTFDMPVMIQVNEDTPPGAVIMTALAEDNDQGQDGRVTYTIVTEGPFVVDMFNGNIYLIGTLDRETSDGFLLEIMARDNAPNEADRRATTASVRVQVMDTNDNYPQCPQHLYYITIHQDTSPRTTLVQLNCTDLDEGSNGKLAFSIVGSEQTVPLAMNETSGVLSLTETVNAPVWQQTLAVAVTDSGISPLSITVYVFITLETQTEYVINQLEDAIAAEAQQNTVSVTIDRVDSKSWSNTVEDALKMTLAQAATGWCALDSESCSILSQCDSSGQRTKRQTESTPQYVSFSQSDVVIHIDSRLSASSLILTTYIRLPAGTAKALTPDTHYVIPRATLEQIVTNNEATIGAVVRDHLQQQSTPVATSWMYIAIAMVVVFVVIIVTAFIIVIIPRIHRKLGWSKSIKVTPDSIMKQQSSTPSSRQASSCDECGSFADVSPSSSTVAVGQWSTFKLRSPATAVIEDIEDIT